MHGFKVPFWHNGKIPKMALLNWCMKFKSYFGRKTYFEAIYKKNIHKMFQSQQNPRFRSVKAQMLDFSQKGLT